MQITDEHEERTVGTYDQNAASWSGDHAGDDSRRLLELFQGLMPSGSILEIGAGPGSEGKLLSEAGYEYFGTDAAKGMVELAKRRFPELLFEVLNVRDLSKLDREFDAVWANAVLLHLPKEAVPQSLDDISKVLKPGGIAFIGLKDGQGEEFEIREKGDRTEERIFTYWGKDEFTELLHDHGFEVALYDYAVRSERSKWHRFYARKVVQ